LFLNDLVGQGEQLGVNFEQLGAGFLRAFPSSG
jgi:hypothetical protein